MVNEERKKRAKALKNKHDLHVLLIMERDGLTKPDAIALAYGDGLSGLEALMRPVPVTPKA